ncbi:hypothetical protein PF005_g18630 [Phytophthora fragariae]|uniref:Uncharacterized protein n=1 Tax=Phytophthora fragariae TaxID=53985 RepID=A0A6A3X4D9_9STRA|nr:hypothetical protein PF003_g19302 [Phytophthora fragariae]KAE8930360.1 hypothetical protein PF009_g19549 [Phytophthora fragariae]KAE8992970.1 hypothetical protein PF011_g17329 [Phytophthora fragariae]KAE9088026.1 hypothetical protein PF007_g20138 [Phytophthora fragariae]KAE9117488.1 hypothetical protein PF006_g18799 [Phytophthora fragariae]
MSLVDDAELLLEPSSGFVYQVAIRHYADELRRVVAIPLEDVRVRHISQAENMMGYYHQLPVAMVFSDFNAVWTAVALPDMGNPPLRLYGASPPIRSRQARRPCPPWTQVPGPSRISPPGRENSMDD